HQYEGHIAKGPVGAHMQFKSLVQRLSPRPVRDQYVASGSSQISGAQRSELVFTSEVPYDQVEGFGIDLNSPLLDVYSYGRVISLREDALHKPLRQAGFADRESTEQTDLFLHQGISYLPGRGSTNRRNTTLRRDASAGSAGGSPL